MTRYKNLVRKTKINLRRGFTLIELLVVIAIIGLLSSIILASVKLAKNKANDAKIKAQLRNFKSAAELYFYNAGNNSYGSRVYGTESAAASIGPGCNDGIFATATIKPFTMASNYPPSTTGTGRCIVDNYKNSGYSVSAKLSDGKYWCVDSLGNATVLTSVQGNSSLLCHSLTDVD